MADIKDFIPAGDDTSAYTDQGFQDFVPAPTPKPQVINEEVVVENEVPEVPASEPENTEVPEEPHQEVVEEQPTTPEVLQEEVAAPVEDPQPEIVQPVDVPAEQTEPAVEITQEPQDQPSELTNPDITPTEVDPELDAQYEAQHPDAAPQELETKPVVDEELARLQAEHGDHSLDEIINNAENNLDPLPDLEPLPEESNG